MEIITISDEARKCLNSLNPQYKKVSEMSESEREFLTELILQKKPKKVLEVGVAAGSSSVVMLNALKYISNDFEFHSIDFKEKYYRDNTKRSGFIVEDYPELAIHRQFYAGGLALNFLAEIGDEIELCFIDTMHKVPGEILDFLMVLPYLKDNAIVVFHDTNLQTSENWRSCNVNNLLVSAISGEKILPEMYNDVFSNFGNNINENRFFPNVAAIQLDNFQKERVWDILNLLTQHWLYSPTQENCEQVALFISKHYGEKFENYFRKVTNHQIYNLNKISEVLKEAQQDEFSEQQQIVTVEKIKQAETSYMLKNYMKLKLIRYRILEKITLGNMRTRYKEEKNNYAHLIKILYK